MRPLALLAAFLLAAFLLAAFLLASPAAAASFDCAKASTPDERTICASQKLSALDVLVSRAYGVAHKSSDSDNRTLSLEDARVFAARKARCGADVGCLVSAHAAVSLDLEGHGSKVDLPSTVAATDMTLSVPAESKVLPEREGECARTRIESIGSRLEGDDFSGGLRVDYADGGSQVSYEKVDALAASRRGDPVLICLVSIPRHCPPGDGRGRYYTATNLRSHRTWSLPDTEHVCGGA